MTTIDSELMRSGAARTGSPKGPVTAARQRRTALVYGAVWLLGLVAFLSSSPALQAAGIGLWMPGAGFVAVGGWAVLLFPLTLALFVVSLVAWFWAGMVLAPLTIWGGSALLAAAMAGEPAGATAPAAVALCMAGTAYLFRRRTQTKREAALEKRKARAGFVAESLAEVNWRAAELPDPTTRELSADDLASLRYILDRALQPIEKFDGFDVIDQFQPAALRYQINHMGFALGVAQGAYVPNFHGYMRQAQRNLIDKYLLRKVWGYWVYESCWGHLNFSNFDPAAKDNIMLTGWFGMHVGQYMLNSGDRSYAEPGSLTFRLNDRTAYRHDFHSIIGSVVSNYERDSGEFCLYPCEPNWIYPICNHYGMTSLAVHDRLFGTSHAKSLLPLWLDKLDTEFTDESGSIIGLRSQLTGFEVPFPVGEAGYANFANCFSPERARRLWAIGRKEIEPLIVTEPDGTRRLAFPGKGLDAGNYRTGHTAALSSILLAAREFGDNEIADAALAGLAHDCDERVEGGVRRYLAGSNLANANAVLGRIMRTGDFRRSFVEGPAKSTSTGPVLAGAAYPDVLVARAFSHGEDLQLVLHPGGTSGGVHALSIERLQPGRRYEVKGGLEQSVAADDAGRAEFSVRLAGRTEVSIVPVAETML